MGAEEMELSQDAMLAAAGGDEDGNAMRSFREILGPDCTVKRVDKDRNILCGAEPEEMQEEMMARAAAQKRLGACADHVKGMTRESKLAWALDVKDKANELYAALKFDEAAKLYNDCLVAMDLEGTEEQTAEVAQKLQLPVCTNLAACMIELGHYCRCIEICRIALSVDSRNPKAAYRRGLANYRLGDHATARPDFELALRSIEERQGTADEDEKKSLADVKRRVTIYLNFMRQHRANEQKACKRMFERDDSLYADRPGVPTKEAPRVDDSDEAIDAALERINGVPWCRCRCRRKPASKEKMA